MIFVVTRTQIHKIMESAFWNQLEGIPASRASLANYRLVYFL